MSRLAALALELLGAPIVPRGAGTGLSGGANAVSGCVTLDLSRMNRVLEIDPDNLVCVVQPGAVNNDVKAAVAEVGLWYPPDPASAAWRPRRAFEQFLDAAIALGGTVTGEHGVGILKRDGIRRELDPGSLALQAAVRRALDPHEVFNPGKGLDGGQPATSAASSAPSSQQASRSCRTGGPVTQTGGRTARHCRPVVIDSTARTAPPVSMPPCT